MAHEDPNPPPRTPASALSGTPMPLPKQKIPVHPHLRAGADGGAARRSATSILLVEDSPGDASLITAALSSRPGVFDVTWVPSLAECLALLPDRSYGGVIIDLGLPDGDGMEVIQQVGARLGDGQALVVMTGRGDEADALAAFHEGVDDYLLKSEFSASGLHRSLKYAIERSKMRAALRSTEQLTLTLSAIVESTADAIFTKRLDGVITTWNGGAERLYGYSAEEIVGQHVRVLHPPGHDESETLLSTVSRGEAIHGHETVRRTKDGKLVSVSLTISPLGDEDAIIGASVIAHDISDRVQLQRQLTNQAMHDTLTGLPNRALLHERLTQAVEETARGGPPLAVFFCDLDRFKSVNDGRGHHGGDQLLVQVAERFQEAVRPGDTVSRWGGDEFVIVCKSVSPRDVKMIAQRLHDALHAPVQVDGHEVHVTTSIGIATAPPVSADADILLRSADAAMYEAKSRGRARSEMSRAHALERSRHELDLVADLRRALETDAITAHFQPVIDLASGTVVGLEALARWEHARRGQVPPEEFVHLAEVNGLDEDVDRHMLLKACAAAKQLLDSGYLPPGATMGVNLSATTVCDPRLPVLVRRALIQTGLLAEHLMIEVTETAVMKDPVAAARSLLVLRRLGVAVALDDFGTGYSSLSLVRTLPVSHLKVDRSFIEALTENADDLTITASVIGLAHGLQIRTIAEGVENVQQLHQLRRLGCEAAQGFLWSPALALDDLVPWLQSPASTRSSGRHPSGRLA